MQYGSLNNLMLTGTKGQPTPEVGMGATELCWTDRHAYTIVEVINHRRIVVQRDVAVRVDSKGMSDSQDYRFEQNPNAKKVTYTLRKNGRWIKEGESLKNGTQIRIGERDEYYDYSF